MLLEVIYVGVISTATFQVTQFEGSFFEDSRIKGHRSSSKNGTSTNVGENLYVSAKEILL